MGEETDDTLGWVLGFGNVVIFGQPSKYFWDRNLSLESRMWKIFDCNE